MPANRKVTFQGQPVTLVGLRLKEGDTARNVRVTGSDLQPVLPLEQSRGKARLFITVPSIDTEVCSLESKKFSDALKEFGDSVAAYLISADLPFAQRRWCVAEGVDNLTTLSDYRDMDFARNWGLLVQELGLLARAVYVVNKDDIITYCEIVPELTSEPNYDAAIEALKIVA